MELKGCDCISSTNERCRFIALTGGPGAGKTAVLELFRQHACKGIALLPESASIIFGGGFWRHDTDAGRRAAQRAIFHTQSELERMVVEEGQSRAAVCDRGALDSLAYWPGTEESFWAELKTSRQELLSRYHAVIHLRTPGSRNGYNHSNPIRTESPEEAARIDQRILRAWEGHPRRIIVESAESFLDKALTAVTLIVNELPEPCRRCKGALWKSSERGAI